MLHIVWLHLVLGVHKPNSIHDTMSLKPNFKLSNQSFSNSYQNRQNHALTTYMKEKKMNQIIGKKNGGKGLKDGKL
jgi:hypothetical protein